MRTSFANAETKALLALLFVLPAVNAAAIPRDVGDRISTVSGQALVDCWDDINRWAPNLDPEVKNYLCPKSHPVTEDMLVGDDWDICMGILQESPEPVKNLVCGQFKKKHKRDFTKEELQPVQDDFNAKHQKRDFNPTPEEMQPVMNHYNSTHQKRALLAARGWMDVVGGIGNAIGSIGGNIVKGLTGGGSDPAPQQQAAPAPAEAAPAEAATPTAEAPPEETVAEEDSTPDLDLTNADAIAEWIVNNADSDSVLATLALSKNSAQLVKTVKTPAFKESTFGTALTEACGGGDDEAAGDDAALERRAAKSIPGKKLGSMSSTAVLKQVSPAVLVGALNADSMDGGLVTDVASGLVAKAKFKKLVCPKPKAAKKGKGKGLGAALKDDSASADTAAEEDASADDSAAAERR